MGEQMFTSAEIENHQTFKLVEEISLKTTQIQDRNPTNVQIIRLLGLCSIIQYNITKSIPIYIPTSVLSSISGELTHINNSLDSVIERIKDDLSFDNLNVSQIISHAESTLTKFPTPFRIKDPKETEELLRNTQSILDDVAESANRYKERTNSAIDELQSSLQSIDDSISKYESNIEEIQNKYSILISSITERFEETQRKRSSEFTEEIETIKSNAQIEIDETTSKYKNKIDNLEAISQEQLNKTEYNIEDMDTRFNENILQQNKIFEDVLKDATELRDKIRDIAGLSSTEGLVGSFHTNANKNQQAAKVMRWTSFVGFVIGVIILLALAAEPLIFKYFYSDITYTVDWKDILARSQIALFVFAPSVFLAWESRKLQNQAISSRDLELRLAAFPLFIDRVSEPEQAQLIKDMAPTFFKPNEYKDLPKEDSVSAGAFKQIIDLIKSLK